MNWNRWARQTHRWLALTFTVAVLINIGLNLLPIGDEELATMVGLLTLVPLVLLLITGLYLFVLPYRTRNAPRPRSDS